MWSVLSDERLRHHTDRLQANLLALANTFPSASTILWRTAHLPKEVMEIPFERVAQLDAMSSYTIENMMREGRQASFRSSAEAALGRKLRFDRTGQMMRGMQ